MKKNRFLKKTITSVIVAAITLGSMIGSFTVASAADSLQGESVYQIMVDRFYDGDSSNNAQGDAFCSAEYTEDDFRYMHGGDWQGIIDKLDYIKGMGYTAIWISPVSDPQLWGMPYNGVQWPTAYHGYNVYDPTRASRYFGCENEQQSKLKLKELTDACHARNIKVIIDVVPNHVGDYIQGTGSDAHYVDYNSSMKTGTQVVPAAPFNNISWYHNNGDIDWANEHPHNAWSTAMLEDHDLGGLDDIDFDNSSAKDTMINSIKYWFDYTGADAARVDAAKCMKPSDIHDLQSQLGVTTFGENFDMDVSFISDWVGDNAENGMLDFPLFQAIVNDFAYGQNFDDTSTGTLSVKNIFDQDNYYGDHVNEMVTFIDNHDRNRFLTEAGGNVDKMQNALAFIFTCRGVPVVFQGTEQNKGNANGQIISGIADTWNRWSMVKKDVNGNVICDYFNQNTNTYKLIASLNNLRSENQALQTGTQREMWASPSFYAFSRRVDSGENIGQEVICAFSNGNNSQQITMPLRAESSLPVGTVLANAMNPNDTITVSSNKKVTINLDGNKNKIYIPSEIPDPDPDPDKIPVTFIVKNAYTNWGESIYITGNTDELGNWDVTNLNVPATCPNYPEWKVTVDIEAGKTIEFKAVKKDDNNNVTWQSGDNNVYTVPLSGAGETTIYWN